MSSCALTQFVGTREKVYSKDEQKNTKFLFNPEHIEASNCLDELTKIAVKPIAADGAVFGPIDFSFSRDDISGEVTAGFALKTAAACEERNLELVFINAHCVNASSIENTGEALAGS